MKVVFVHGNSSSATSFDRVDISHDVKAISLIGHDGRERDQYSIDLAVSDLVDQLKDEEAICLIGHSLGGHICIDAVSNLTCVKGLVLTGTPPLKKPVNIENAFLPNPSLELSLSELYDTSNLESRLSSFVENQTVLPKLLEDFEKTDGRFRKALAETLDQFKNQVEVLVSLNIPILFLNGKLENIVNLQYVEKVAKLCSGVFQLIEQSRHYPHMENPKAFTEAIEDFVNHKVIGSGVV